MTARRGRFAALAAGTILLGLLLQRTRGALPAVPADVLGDALWAAMMYWLVSAALPAAPPGRRALVATGICWGVECAQLLHVAPLDAWRRTTLGHLVLGSDFDPRDLVACVAGVLAATGLERVLGGAVPTRDA